MNMSGPGDAPRRIRNTLPGQSDHTQEETEQIGPRTRTNAIPGLLDTIAEAEAAAEDDEVKSAMREAQSLLENADEQDGADEAFRRATELMLEHKAITPEDLTAHIASSREGTGE